MELQQKLHLIAMMDDQYLSPADDGRNMGDVLRLFQQVNGLPVSGQADAATRQRIDELYDDLLQLIADPHAVCPFPSPYHVVQEGENGSLIHILQAMLAEICREFTVAAPSVSGVYDEDTQACIRRWQQILGLPVNGMVDRFCWDRLADLYNMRLL